MKEERYDFMLGNTTDEEIDSAIDGNLDIVSVIRMEMTDDDENDTHHLLSLYKEADKKERAIMDALMISICGWTLSSLIRIADENGFELEN